MSRRPSKQEVIKALNCGDTSKMVAYLKSEGVDALCAAGSLWIPGWGRVVPSGERNWKVIRSDSRNHIGQRNYDTVTLRSSEQLFQDLHAYMCDRSILGPSYFEQDEDADPIAAVLGSEVAERIKEAVSEKTVTVQELYDYLLNETENEDIELSTHDSRPNIVRVSFTDDVPSYPASETASEIVSGLKHGRFKELREWLRGHGVETYWSAKQAATLIIEGWGTMTAPLVSSDWTVTSNIHGFKNETLSSKQVFAAIQWWVEIGRDRARIKTDDDKILRPIAVFNGALTADEIAILDRALTDSFKAALTTKGKLHPTEAKLGWFAHEVVFDHPSDPKTGADAAMARTRKDIQVKTVGAANESACPSSSTFVFEEFAIKALEDVDIEVTNDSNQVEGCDDDTEPTSSRHDHGDTMQFLTDFWGARADFERVYCVEVEPCGVVSFDVSDTGWHWALNDDPFEGRFSTLKEACEAAWSAMQRHFETLRQRIEGDSPNDDGNGSETVVTRYIGTGDMAGGLK